MLFLAAVIVMAGLAVRKNWWGLADQMSGRHISAKPLDHEKSWTWKATMAFGGAFMAFGFIVGLAYFYILIWRG